MIMYTLTIGEDINAIFTALGEIVTMIMSNVGNVLTTVTSTAIIFVPVLCALAATVILTAIKLVKKFGVRGISKRGRKRRRAR